MKRRNITEFQILSEIMRKQPHIKQREIAEALGITVQGVSEHIRNLLRKGYITSRGRGKYVLTEKGIWVLKNWISQFRDYLEEVNRNIYRYKDIWPAIAYEDIEDGERVYLFMRRGLLYASKYVKAPSTAEVVEGGRRGEDIAITNIEGIIEMEKGKVTVIRVPPRINGGSKNVNYHLIREILDRNRDAVVASMGTVSYVVSQKLKITPEIRFAVLEGIVKACERGCNVVCLVTGRMTERVVKVLDSNRIKYTVLDATKSS